MPKKSNNDNIVLLPTLNNSDDLEEVLKRVHYTMVSLREKKTYVQETQ